MRKSKECKYEVREVFRIHKLTPPPLPVYTISKSYYVIKEGNCVLMIKIHFVLNRINMKICKRIFLCLCAIVNSNLSSNDVCFIKKEGMCYMLSSDVYRCIMLHKE